MLLMRDNRNSPENLSESRCSLWCSLGFSSINKWVRPVTAYSGVLSSCVMVDKNRALAKDAFSAFSFANCNSVFLSCSRVFALALKLLFLYSDKVSKESIAIIAILRPFVITFKFSDFSLSKSFSSDDMVSF